MSGITDDNRGLDGLLNQFAPQDTNIQATNVRWVMHGRKVECLTTKKIGWKDRLCGRVRFQDVLSELNEELKQIEKAPPIVLDSDPRGLKKRLDTLKTAVLEKAEKYHNTKEMSWFKRIFRNLHICLFGKNVHSLASEIAQHIDNIQKNILHIIPSVALKRSHFAKDAESVNKAAPQQVRRTQSERLFRTSIPQDSASDVVSKSAVSKHSSTTVDAEPLPPFPQPSPSPPRPIDPVPFRGINNPPGLNVCNRIAVLQCLLQMPAFLRAVEFPLEDNPALGSLDKRQAVQESLKEMIKQIREGKSPQDLFDQEIAVCTTIDDWKSEGEALTEQQDATDYLKRLGTILGFEGDFLTMFSNQPEGVAEIDQNVFAQLEMHEGINDLQQLLNQQKMRPSLHPSGAAFLVLPKTQEYVQLQKEGAIDLLKEDLHKMPFIGDVASDLALLIEKENYSEDPTVIWQTALTSLLNQDEKEEHNLDRVLSDVFLTTLSEKEDASNILTTLLLPPKESAGDELEDVEIDEEEINVNELINGFLNSNPGPDEIAKWAAEQCRLKLAEIAIRFNERLPKEEASNISFEPETLLTFPDGTQHQITGIVIYEGYGDRGHYYSLVRAPNSTWMHCNDDKIRKTKTKDFAIARNSAYILCTQRKDA